MPEEQLTKKFSLIEMIIGTCVSLTGAALLVGLSYGGLSNAQETTTKKVEQNESAISEMRDHIAELKTESAVTAVRVENIEKNTEKIQEALDTLLTRIPNGQH